MGNSKAISLLFGLIVGVISTFSAYILAEMEPTKLGSITIISFASSTLLFAIITEYLFDRKIALIYKSFDKLKKKEFDDLEYTFFNTDGSSDRSVNPSLGQNDFQEYEYSAGVTDDGIGTPLTEFISFSIKIVMQSTNMAAVPRIGDLRAIALAI